MGLQQTVALSSFGQELLGGTGATSRVANQVTDAARPTLSSVTSRLNQVSAGAAGAFNSAEGTLARQERALGANVTDTARASTRRRIGLSRALATVDASNREISAIRSQADMARSSSSSLRDLIEGQVLSGRSAAAQLETGREMDYQSQLAEYRAKKRQGLGAVAGMALSFVPGGTFLAPTVSGAIANG